MNRFVRAASLAAVMAMIVFSAVAAQTPTPPETFEIPAFDSGAIVSSAFGAVGGFLGLMVTMVAIRQVPKVIAAVRRSMSAATGR